MASRRDRLTGNTPTTTATKAKRPKRKPSSTNKPKKSRSGGGSSTQQPTSTSVGYYDENAVGTSDGLYDSGSTYGRTPTGQNVGTFNEWLANNGYANKNNLNKNKRQRLQQQYTSAKGPQGEYATTDEGEQMSNEDPDRYYSWLMGEAGGMAGDVPQYGGPTAFGQFLANDYRGYVDQGYEAAKMQSGSNLNFADYMSSIGWAPNQQQNTLIGAGPRDTGNPYTSSSMPTPQVHQSYNTVQDYAQAQGINKNWNQMNKGRRNRIRNAYTENENAYTASLTDPAPNPTAPALPDIPGVDGLANARKMFNALTPQQRGINGSTANRSGRWAVYG